MESDVYHKCSKYALLSRPNRFPNRLLLFWLHLFNCEYLNRSRIWMGKNPRYICKTSASIFMSAGAIIRPRLIRREFIMRNALCFCLSSEGNARKRSILWRSAVTSHLSSDKATSSFVYLCNTAFVVEIFQVQFNSSELGRQHEFNK